jgi:hypothetical protein
MKNRNLNNGGRELIKNFRLKILDFRLKLKRLVCHLDGGEITLETP